MGIDDRLQRRNRGDERRQRDLLNLPPLGLNKRSSNDVQAPNCKNIFPQSFICFSSNVFTPNLLGSK
jgi:hypothetical protein